MSTSRLSTGDTKRLIEHACASGKTMNAVRLAEFLGIKPPRISEGRSGEWRLPQELAEKLIGEFGQPRSKAGRYLIAERAESIRSFINDEAPLSRLSHLLSILRVLCSSEYQHALADAFSFLNSSSGISRSVMVGASGPEPNASDRREKLMRLDELMDSEEFEEWLSAASGYIGKWRRQGKGPGSISYELRDLYDQAGFQNVAKVARELGISIEYRRLATELYLIGKFKAHCRAGDIEPLIAGVREFRFQSPMMKQAPEFLGEYVVTGECVWNQEGRFDIPKVGLPAIDKMFDHDWVDRPFDTYLLGSYSIRDDGYPTSQEGIFSMAVDRWDSYAVSLYIKDNCDYSLIIELAGDQLTGDWAVIRPIVERSIIIPKISGLALFNELDALRKWLALPDLPLVKIKKEIAMAGGYIPGAEVV